MTDAQWSVARERWEPVKPMRDALPEDLDVIRAFSALYDDRGCWARSTWLGKQVSKSATDLWSYQEVLSELRPDVLIETGTAGGGSAHFFAGVFDLLGKGRVVTVDTQAYPELHAPHERIMYVHGDCLSDDVRAVVCKEIDVEEQTFADGGGPYMDRPVVVVVVLDAAHTYEHVRRELDLYAPLVSVGSWCVVEDVGIGPLNLSHDWCGGAIVEFLAAHPEFQLDDAPIERHLASAFKWLKRGA